MYIHAGNPRMPPQVLASGPKACGGNKVVHPFCLMDFGSQWNIARRDSLKKDHPEKTNQKTRRDQLKRDHGACSTYQHVPKAYTKYNK